jgi:hypothetical protein
MIGLVALDQVLRLFFRGTNRVILEFDWGSDLFLDRSANAACFRVPTYMIPHSEFAFHVLHAVVRVVSQMWYRLSEHNNIQLIGWKLGIFLGALRNRP